MNVEAAIQELRLELDNLRRNMRVTVPAQQGVAGQVVVQGQVEPYWGSMAPTKADIESVLTGEISTHTHAGGGATDHGALTGLTDDDHSHYHNDARGDARYYTQAAADALLGAKANSSHNHDSDYAALSHSHSASDIDSGTLADARVAASNVLQHQTALTVTESQISDLDDYITGIDKADVEAVLTGEISSHSHAGGAGDHGALSGLADDDHPQYHNDARGDARYVSQAAATAALAGKSDVGHSHAASDITSGQLASTRISEASVTQHQAALTITESQISDLTTLTKAAVEAVLIGEISTHSHAGGGSSFDSAPGVLMASGTTTITNADTTIAIDTEEEDPSSNYVVASSEATITNGGWMFLSYSIPVNDGGSSGGTRARVYAWVEIDTGGGYSVITQSRAQDYAREASGGEGLGTGFVANIPDGAKVRLRIRQSGTTALNTESGETQISMFRLST